MKIQDVSFTAKSAVRKTSIFTRIHLICLTTLLFACSSCATKNIQEKQAEVDYIENSERPLVFVRDTLLKVSANPKKGFNFAYYLFLPATIKNELRPVMYVEPNNTGTQNDDLSFHDKAARKFIESSYSHRIAKRLQSPMLVPVFPRPAADWQTYTHYLNRRTMKISEGPLRRIDLQLVAMIEDARERLQQSNVVVSPKVFMNGFSSSAGFTLRFTAIHPHLIQATAAGGINAMPILPLKKWNGKPLAYPMGVADLKELTGKEFDSSAFLKIPQKLYMGALDANDTVPYRDAWDEGEADFIRRNFSEKMMPDRWEKIQKIYQSTGADVTFNTYSDVGHKVTPEIEEDIFRFFSTHREGLPEAIYVLGSIHGNMLNQPHNSLRDFVGAIQLFRPTLILSEVRPEFPNSVDGTIDGGPEQSLVYAYANENHVQLIPVDWFDDQYNLDSERESNQMPEALKKEIEPLFARFRKVVQNGSFVESQSSGTQSLIRARYDHMAQKGFAILRKRDEAVCKNIRAQLPSFQNKRVLIVFGLAHKYFLEDCVRGMGLKPLSVEDWFDPGKVRQTRISDELKNAAVQTFAAAKSLLQNRLTQGYYKTDVENLKDKSKEFDEWIRRTREL